MIPLGAEPDDIQKQQAIALLKAGLGQAELEIAASFTVPFLWTLRKNASEVMFKGGSAFFIDTGECVIAVTAAHVVEACMQDSKSREFDGCMLDGGNGSPIPFHLGDRLIDAHHDIDIATFRMKSEEIHQTGREILKGYYYPKWPPPLPQQDKGVTFCGFPGVGRRWSSLKEISLGRIALSGVATNSHELAISIQLERENLVRILGNEPFPDNYDFGGISGGPLIAAIETSTIRHWMPAGVVIQGPNPSGTEGQSIHGLEIIRARPLHFIKANGELDIARWEQSN